MDKTDYISIIEPVIGTNIFFSCQESEEKSKIQNQKSSAEHSSPKKLNSLKLLGINNKKLLPKRKYTYQHKKNPSTPSQTTQNPLKEASPTLAKNKKFEEPPILEISAKPEKKAKNGFPLLKMDGDNNCCLSSEEEKKEHEEFADIEFVKQNKTKKEKKKNGDIMNRTTASKNKTTRSKTKKEDAEDYCSSSEHQQKSHVNYMGNVNRKNTNENNKNTKKRKWRYKSKTDKLHDSPSKKPKYNQILIQEIQHKGNNPIINILKTQTYKSHS